MTSFTFAPAGLLAAALMLGSIAPAHAVPTLSLVPSTTTVMQNQTFSVGVRATDVTDLFGYQFNVSFDASLFRVTGVTGGSFLSTGGPTFFAPGEIDNATGNVSFVFETILGDVRGVNGSGLLGTINLAALGTASGTGSVGLSEAVAVNSTLDNITLAPISPASVTVAVAAIPEPSTWAMLSLGLVGMVGLRRQRLSAAKRAAAV